MSLAQRSSSPDHWKTKYLDSLNDLEVKEQNWSELEAMLRRAITRLALAGYGNDPALDQQLDRLRKAVKRGRDSERVCELVQRAADLASQPENHVPNNSRHGIKPLQELLALLNFPPAFSKPIKQLSRDLAALGSTQDPGPLVARLAEILDSAFQTPGQSAPTNGGLFSRLFGPQQAPAAASPQADPGAAGLLHLLDRCTPSPTQADLREQAIAVHTQSERDAVSVRLASLLSTAMAPAAAIEAQSTAQSHRWLRELVQKLSFPAALEPRVDAIKEQLESPLELAHVPGVLEQLAALIGEVQRGIEEEKQEIGDFLKGITERIQSLDETLQVGRQTDDDGISDSRILRDSVRDQVSNLRSEVAEAGNLADLKTSIIGSLDTVESHISEYLVRQSSRHEKSQAIIGSLDDKLKEMRSETEDLKQRVRKAQEEATLDMLTGLANRRALEQRLREEYARCQRYSKSLSMVILDIDHFKKVNDTYGHKAGDKALKVLAARVREAIRETDFVARYGGEEFVILMPETSLEGAYTVADKLRQAVVDCPFHYRSQPVQITVSCGIGEFRPGDTPEAFFQRVDDALYTAKNTGRNRCETAAAA